MPVADTVEVEIGKMRLELPPEEGPPEEPEATLTPPSEHRRSVVAAEEEGGKVTPREDADGNPAAAAAALYRGTPSFFQVSRFTGTGEESEVVRKAEEAVVEGCGRGCSDFDW